MAGRRGAVESGLTRVQPAAAGGGSCAAMTRSLDDRHRDPDGGARLERRLAGLDVEPPPGFGLRVLERVGIVDLYAPADTVIGRVYVAFNRRGISRIDRAGAAEEFEERFVAAMGRPLRRAGLPAAVGRALESGDGSGLDYDLRGISAWWRAVLETTLRIRRGEVRSYTWVAAGAGRPRAVRAAGSALAANPVPLLIPCHRVVRLDGHIGNYGLGGPSVKRRLLDHEGWTPPGPVQLDLGT